MPRFNSVTGSITGLMRDWFDATRTVYQDCSLGFCKIVLSDGTFVSLANSPLVTGGGSQAAWENSDDLAVHDALSRTWPGAGLARGCSPDGAYALKIARNSYGPWDVIERNGDRWRLSNGDAHNIQLLGNKKAYWMLGVDDFTTPGLPVRIPLEHHYGMRLAWVPEEQRYITLYQRASDGALVCDGHIVAPPSDKYFYPDIDYRNLKVRIVWSLSTADFAEVPPLEMTLDQVYACPVSEDNPPPKPPDPTPIPPDPPKPIPPDPPKPVIPPKSKYYTLVEVKMSNEVEIVAIKGPGGKFGRIDASELGKGPFGWFPVHFDRDTPDDSCKFELSKPDTRFKLQHVVSRALLGLDATQFSTDIPKEFYGKPDAPDARGAYESPVICYDPLDKSLIFGYIPYYAYSFVSSGFGVIKL